MKKGSQLLPQNFVVLAPQPYTWSPRPGNAQCPGSPEATKPRDPSFTQPEVGVRKSLEQVHFARSGFCSQVPPSGSLETLSHLAPGAVGFTQAVISCAPSSGGQEKSPAHQSVTGSRAPLEGRVPPERRGRGVSMLTAEAPELACPRQQQISLGRAVLWAQTGL